MISRFFIDRPIFASVVSIVITLIGAIALYFLPIAQYPRITPPGVSISIQYPGASAQVVADTVAAPIEQQVNGVEGMLYMSSQMGNDGSYTLTVTFDIGVDLNTALVMVQNRVALAMPQLPTQVQNQGITIRKRTPDILLIVNFYADADKPQYDDIYLSNYATIYCKDELLRVPGISDMSYQGERDYSIRAWLDPQKLASRNMTALDVANAIRDQNTDCPAGMVGQQPSPPGQFFTMPLDTLGRLSTPEQFGDIIVKSTQTSLPQRVMAAAPPVLGAIGGWYRIEQPNKFDIDDNHHRQQRDAFADGRLDIVHWRHDRRHGDDKQLDRLGERRGDKRRREHNRRRRDVRRRGTPAAAARRPAAAPPAAAP